MKVLVEEVETGMSIIGGVVSLTGSGYVLRMGIPDLTAKKIALVKRPDRRDDSRELIEDILKDQITNLEIEELYIDNINLEGTYSSVLKINGQERRMVPSEGILLCTIAGKPIYFDNELEGVKELNLPL